MKNFKKRISLISLALLGSASFLGGMAISQTAMAEPTALESEFTGNGQFAVSYYTGSTAYAYEFVDVYLSYRFDGICGSVL